MASFFVFDTWVLASRKLFILSGEIREGEIKIGMQVHIRPNSNVAMTAPIHAVEFARREGGEDICLCILYKNEKELSFLQGLNIGNEVVKITN
jgi:hypothetical protein